MKAFSFFSLMFFSFLTNAQELKLIFAGDIMQHETQLKAAGPDKNGNYNYSANYEEVLPIISEADLALANLELTLAGEPYSGYPTFSAPDALAANLKEAGFDILVTANNHSMDRRQNGLERTIDVLDSLKFSHTGTFKNQKEREINYPLFVEEKGIKLAILNYTYGTNGIPVNAPNIVNLLSDTVQINSDIDRAKEENADMIITFLHWGSEYQSKPNTSQKRTAEWLRNKGVNMVIGSHPHVLQPIELEKTADATDFLVAWSLGNFISNQRTRYRDGGIILEVNIVKSDDKIAITNAGYHLSWVAKESSPNSEFYIIPAANREAIKRHIKSEKDRAAFELFLKDSRKLFEAYNKNVSELDFNFYK